MSKEKLEFVDQLIQTQIMSTRESLCHYRQGSPVFLSPLFGLDSFFLLLA